MMQMCLQKVISKEYSRIPILIWIPIRIWIRIRIRIHTKMSWIRNNVPGKTCRHHTFGGTYVRVGHAVDGVEDPQWH